MSDTPRRDGPPQQPYGNQGGGDPAYQYPPPLYGDPNQSPTHAAPRPQGFHEQPTYPPTYQSPADANPTQQLPAGYQQGGYQQGGYQTGGYDSSQYNQYGQPPPNQYGGQPWSDGNPPEPPDPEEPGSRMWLWAIAGVAVLLVIGLVVAVFIVNSSSQETVVAPPIQPSASAPTTTPRTTTSRTPTPAPTPSDTTTTETSGSATPGVTEEVVYSVTGDGKALNITYIDEGGGFQTEFNVTLPWTKTVQLAQPAKDTASVSIVKLGGEISCSITVAGAQVSTRSGRGVTMCRSDS